MQKKTYYNELSPEERGELQKAAFEDLESGKTLRRVAEKYNVAPSSIYRWYKVFKESEELTEPV